MYKSMTIFAAAALMSSGALAQMSTNPSTGTTMGTGGSNQSMGTREQECRAMTNADARTRCLDNLNVSGPAGSGNNSQSTGSAPGATNSAPNSSGSGSSTGSGSTGSGTGSTGGTTR